MKAKNILLAAVLFFTAGAFAQVFNVKVNEPSAAEMAANSILEVIDNELAHRAAVHRVCFETLWKNQREGATPEAILEKLGTNAALVFQFSALNVDHLGDAAQIFGKVRTDLLKDEDCIPPKEFTVHEDGTVTINAE